MRLALAQLNALVGDLEGNGERLLAACLEAARQGARLLLTPELSLWGYPPRDLLLRGALLRRQEEVLHRLASGLPEGLAVLVGVAEPIAGGGHPALYNAMAQVDCHGWRIVCRKRLLPSYDVFDERRYFRAGESAAVLEITADGRPWRLGLTICEDLWVEEDLQGHKLAGADPIAELLPHQVDVLLNLSASPFGQGKAALRRRLAARAAARRSAPGLYVNQVGGNDARGVDGGSFVVNAAGSVVCQLACGAPDLALWEATAPLALGGVSAPQELDNDEELLRVLCLGVKDYARKCGFRQALLGLSGGIDSALVAVIAAGALGAENVQALLMPSPWSSTGSIDDATALAERLGLATHTVPIGALMGAFDGALGPLLGGPPQGLPAENLQSRIRGSLLMAVANQQGQLLLATGNKSELAVGYCTLYGDMNGGLAVIGDLYKTSVYRLCTWIDSPASAGCRQLLNLPATGPLIGEAILHKAPSAELRPNQRDSDSLPPYEVLDPVLKGLVERLATPEELVAEGMATELVERVTRLVQRAEFKRRQAAPVLKVSGRAFGSGWRMPIAAKMD
ncbi:MAG: NAD+ synthase [Cyanobacteriota bacterium]